MEKRSWKRSEFHQQNEARKGRNREDQGSSFDNHGRSNFQEVEKERRKKISEEQVGQSGEKQNMMILGEGGVGEGGVVRFGGDCVEHLRF